MPSSEPPRSDREPNVTFLVDRLPLYLPYGCKGELGDATGAQEDILRAGELGRPEAVERLASGG